MSRRKQQHTAHAQKPYFLHPETPMSSGAPVFARQRCCFDVVPRKKIGHRISLAARWGVDCPRQKGWLGTVEANGEREVYAAPIEKFAVAIERQSRPFTVKIKND